MDLKSKNNNNLNKNMGKPKQTDEKERTLLSTTYHFELLHYIAAAFHLLSSFLILFASLPFFLVLFHYFAGFHLLSDLLGLLDHLRVVGFVR